MKQWNNIRQRVLVQGVSKREILRETGNTHVTAGELLKGKRENPDIPLRWDPVE